MELEITIERGRSYFIPALINFPIYFCSEYVKIFDGNGTEVWNSTSSNRSSSLQQTFFEDSKNITIQVSLTSQWSYVKISYGALKKPLNSGRENRLAACDARLCPLHEIRVHLICL